MVGAAVAGGLGPVLRGGGFKCPLRADAGRERDAGDGEADHLPLAAALAADGGAHEEDRSEVRGTKGGAAEGLIGAIQAAERDSAGGGQVAVDGVVVRGVRTIFAAGIAVEWIRGAHLFLAWGVARGGLSVEELFCGSLSRWGNAVGG